MTTISRLKRWIKMGALELGLDRMLRVTICRFIIILYHHYMHPARLITASDYMYLYSLGRNGSAESQRVDKFDLEVRELVFVSIASRGLGQFKVRKCPKWSWGAYESPGLQMLRPVVLYH